MRILIAIANKSMGGAQRVAMHLCGWLNTQQNVRAALAVLSPCGGRQYDMSRLETYELKGSKVKGLKRVIAEFKPDVVLSMGVPMAIHTVPACIMTKTPHIISERNDPAHFAGKTSTRVLSRLFMRAADGYVFQTCDAADFYGGKIQANSVVIPNPLFNVSGMSPERYEGEREKTIVSVGRLNSQKNQAMLIKAFAAVRPEFPEYRLKIWGEGTERGALEALIKSLGIGDFVSLPGNTDKVFEEIYKDSLFVLSSDFEGMPNALMEAMALGLPCVSTDCPCGGPKDLIENGVNGALINVGDETALAEAMRKLLADTEKANEMARKAMAIRSTHAMEAICERWLEYFRKIAK